MKTTHTPGPWLLVEQGDANEYAVLTPDKKEWVIAFRLNPGLPIYAQEKANAKLIAAAPELLQACISAMQDTIMLLNETAEFTPENLESTIEVLSNAIKKATE